MTKRRPVRAHVEQYQVVGKPSFKKALRRTGLTRAPELQAEVEGKLFLVAIPDSPETSSERTDTR
jgi:hypothetical protein